MLNAFRMCIHWATHKHGNANSINTCKGIQNDKKTDWSKETDPLYLLGEYKWGFFLNEKVVQDNVYCLTKNMILQLRNKVQLSLREYYQFCSHKLKYSTHLRIYGGARWKVEGSANFWTRGEHKCLNPSNGCRDATHSSKQECLNQVLTTNCYSMSVLD